jgi:hypothetical protein
MTTKAAAAAAAVAATAAYGPEYDDSVQAMTGPDKRRCVPCACSVMSVGATSTLGKCHTM